MESSSTELKGEIAKSKQELRRLLTQIEQAAEDVGGHVTRATKLALADLLDRVRPIADELRKPPAKHSEH